MLFDNLRRIIFAELNDILLVGCIVNNLIINAMGNILFYK
jgi:hypothetical protein